MTKTHIGTLICAAALLAAACSTTDEQKIRRSAQGYLDAMGNYHIDAAKRYSSQHTVDNTLPQFHQILEHADTAFINHNQPATITIQRVQINTDSTATVYFHKSTPLGESDGNIPLVLEKGKWLVDIHLNPLPKMSFDTTPHTISPDEAKRLRHHRPQKRTLPPPTLQQ